MSARHTNSLPVYSPGWMTQPDPLTGNDVITSYLNDKMDKRTGAERIRVEVFRKNLMKVQLLSEKLFNNLIASKFQPLSVHVKANSITNFSVLFIVDKNDFVKEEFRKAFIMARELETSIEDNSFIMSFIFTPASDTLDEKSLLSDGFFMKYYAKK